MFLPSLRHIFLMLYFGDNGWMDGWMRVSGYLTDKNTANFCPHYCNIYSDCKIISIWLLLGRCTFFFKKKQYYFLTVDVLVDEQDLKEYKLWRFSFFPIPCISCMLMFCACFCKDWMRYCNILATIALDSCTSQLSINMLKE